MHTDIVHIYAGTVRQAGAHRGTHTPTYAVLSTRSTAEHALACTCTTRCTCAVPASPVCTCTYLCMELHTRVGTHAGTWCGKCAQIFEVQAHGTHSTARSHPPRTCAHSHRDLHLVQPSAPQCWAPWGAGLLSPSPPSCSRRFPLADAPEHQHRGHRSCGSLGHPALAAWHP